MSVPARFIHVGFHFAGLIAPVTEIEKVEKVFANALDWIRYDQHCWIIYSTTELDTWRDRLHAISDSYSFFLTEFGQDQYSGYHIKEIWEWLGKDRSQ